MSDLTATTSRERILELDLMRGFALFGILIANMSFFGLPFYTVISEINPFNDPADRAVRFLVGVLFEGKFITLFSFMFGLGFWIFVSRARAKGRSAGPLFLRRLLILGVFGAAHAFLFWAGDILLFYALLGLVMMVFLNRSDKTLRIWIVLLPVVHIGLITVFVAFFTLGMNHPDSAAAIGEAMDQARLEMEAMAATAMESYRTGTFAEMMTIRRQELAFAYQGFIMGGVGVFYLLAVFLAGMYAGRVGWFSNLPARIATLRRRVPWLLLFGFACAVPGYVIMRGVDVIIPGWHTPLYLLLFIAGSPALASAYVILLLSSWHRFSAGIAAGSQGSSAIEASGSGAHVSVHRSTAVAWFWQALGDLGRMSLTIYLTQTLVMTTLFYGYGFGLYGTLPLWIMLLIAVPFFVLQMAAARWWMARYTMGPLEWLWRAATYGYLPAIRKNG